MFALFQISSYSYLVTMLNPNLDSLSALSEVPLSKINVVLRCRNLQHSMIFYHHCFCFDTCISDTVCRKIQLLVSQGCIASPEQRVTVSQQRSCALMTTYSNTVTNSFLHNESTVCHEEQPACIL